MRTFAATVLVAAACFLVFSDAQTSVTRPTMKPTLPTKPTPPTKPPPPTTPTKRPPPTTPTTKRPPPSTTPTTKRPPPPTTPTTKRPTTPTTKRPPPPTTPTTKPTPPTTTTKRTTTTTKPTTTINYCSIRTCKRPSENTLCLYSNTTWGKGCQPGYPKESIVTDADIKTILKVHNEYRRKVAQGLETQGSPGPQPKAANMKQLKWDQELAVMAAAHAQQCVYKHDTCRDVPRFQVGQNIYISSSSDNNLGTSDWDAAITEWYNEVQYMEPTFVTSFPASPPNVIGHYTQVVWADTYLVGCAVAYFQSTAVFGPEFPYNRFYVCNYGPTGNWIGSPVYSQGPAGSACPAGTANSGGLCV